MKRVACYLRVSTQEQKMNGLSIDSQYKALKDYCEAHDCVIVDFYNDAGISASKSYRKRPELLRMIEDVKAKKIDLIIMTKLDRFFRSVKDYYAVMEQIGDTPWRAIWEDYETETSSGRFKVNIMLSIAQAESDRTSERIKAINDYKKAKGELVGGTAPLGYKIVKNQMLIDEDARQAVSAFFKAYMLSYSPSDAINAINAYDVPNVSRARAMRILKSNVYAGDAYGSPCEAYITSEEHFKILESLETRKTRENRAKHTYIFAGALRCGECGGTMASHSNRCTAHGKNYYYKTYRCASHTDRRGCDNAKVFFETTIERYLLDNLDGMLADAHERISAEISEKEIVDVGKNIKKLKKKFENLKLLFEDGDIELDEYRIKRDAIKKEMQALEHLSSPARNIEPLPLGWKEQYEELDDEHKKMFWARIPFEFVCNKDKSITVK